MGLSDCFIDVTSLPAGGYGFAQLLFLFFAYGYILMFSSNMISDGSELLLLVPSLAGIVGSIVLPILGAVPDGAIVLFSGMGPDAQNQLSVGVGALAGSTIMLLTIPWCLSVYAGRVNMKDGAPNYKGRPKLSPENAASLTGAGVVLGHNVHVGGWIMIATSLTYLLLQGPGVFYMGQPLSVVAAHQQYWSLAGLVACTGLFMAYLWYQYQVAQSDDSTSAFNDKKDAVIAEGIKDGEITLFGALQPEMAEAKLSGTSESTSFLHNTKERKLQRLEGILRPFFAKYDRDRNGTLSMDELSSLFLDMGEQLPAPVIATRFKKFDVDGSGSIDFKEFVVGTYELMQSNDEFKTRAALRGLRASFVAAPGSAISLNEENDDEEEPEMPEDLADLTPEEQQYRVKVRASYLMALGTTLVLLFSDPMVDVLNEIGVRLDINPFYVAFVLAPLASNASELIASFNYAQKKTPKTISISVATLEGAACMNNTFGLAIFMFLIYYQDLAWEYLAETCVILVVQVAVGILAMKNYHTLLDGLLILSLYPLSMMLCSFLESLGWD